MVGNDIVDLRERDADPSSLSPRFDARVFAPDERARIDAAADASRERWRHWAAKEASYKLARQLARERGEHAVFSPVRFRVALDVGRVYFDGDVYDVALREGEDFVHAIAIPAGASFDATIIRERRRDIADVTTESAAVRELAREVVSQSFGHSLDTLTIRRDDRIPSVWRADERLPLSLSFSHHGRHIAVACQPAPSTASRSSIPPLLADAPPDGMRREGAPT